jgi:hypothetical protein
LGLLGVGKLLAVNDMDGTIRGGYLGQTANK